MNIRFYFFIGFLVTQLAIVACRNNSGCPNSPVTTYPTQKPISDCPNMAVPLSQKPSFENQQVILCPAMPANLACNFQCQCCFSQCCQECDLNATSQCCQGYGLNNLSCVLGLTCSKPNIPPTPAPLIKCPPGTHLLGKRCHLLYCPRGSKMMNDRCIAIECPEGSIWTGNRCSVPKPIIQNVTFYTNIVSKFNQTKPDIILNNANNILVNTSVVLSDNIKYIRDCNYDYGDCDEAASSSVATSTASSKCCEVMTPRICEERNNRWRCYSRRSRRCGEFCVAPIIYLRPSRIHATPKYLVMPPIQNHCALYGNCGHLLGGYDCSGCAFDNMERCSHYCYRYTCPSRKCNFYDQEKYCDHRVGLFGCQQEDGCLDNWCL